MRQDEYIRIDSRQPGANAVAMLAYLAALIYPGSHRRRDQFIGAALAYGVRVAKHNRKPVPKWSTEVLTAVRARPQQNRLQAAHRILRRRIEAATALEHILLSKGRMTLTGASKHCGGNRSHFMHSSWADSQPVLHLASALLVSFEQDVADRRPLLLSLIARPEWAMDAVKASERRLEMLSRCATMPEFAAVLERFEKTPKVRIVAHCADSPTV